ncbi:MAG: ATP-binding cassette domain-containing protein, partial [Candidatus Thermoplasmatota archaeon]
MNALVNGDIVARLSNVSRDYKVGPTTVHALSGVSLEIPRGDFTVFLGPSGSGKTTLLNIVGGIEAPTSGKVEVDGERIDDL